MTFEELKTEIKDRMGYTSTSTDARIGRLCNKVYRAVTSSIGIRKARYSKVSMAVTANDPEVVFSGVERIIVLWRETSASIPTIIYEVPIERLRESKAGTSDRANNYAVKSVTSNTITIRLDATPSTAYTLYADVIAEISDLSGSQEPAFPESFHDVLIEGVLRDEYRKQEKIQLARDSDQTFQQRLSDLRMHLATSAYMDMQQGIYSPDTTYPRSGIGSGSGSSAASTELNDLYAAEIVLLAQIIA